jgi:DNA repair protein RecN (Recombination protein N)
VLELLKIKNVALVQALDLEWAPGLNLITGETGSGKSILLDALGFALGQRASVELIRQQADSAQVEARFGPPDAWRKAWTAWFESKGLKQPAKSLSLSRELGRQGRGRAWIDGQSVAVSVLAELGQGLVDFHGQHDHQALLRVAEHQVFLDRFGTLDIQAGAVREAWAKLQERRRALLGTGLSPAERKQRLDFLDFQIRELEELHPKAGEAAELLATVSLQASGAKRAELFSRASDALSQDEGGAVVQAEAALAALSRLSELDPRQEELVRQLDAALVELRDVAERTREAGESLDLDPQALERLQSRLHTFERLAKKHLVETGELPQLYTRLREERQGLQFLMEDEEGLKTLVTQAETAFAAAALTLSQAREKAAAAMVKALSRELQELVSPNALFTVRLERRFDPAGPFLVEGEQVQGGPDGVDDIEFLFAPNLGEAPKPLARIASGGELSRVTLALKAVLSRQEGAPCLVFDEIDTGISGRVAALVGQKILGLAERHQILCITHLPQIASLPGRHINVSKRSDRGQTYTEAAFLDDAGRQREVAALLAGKEPGESALANARELLQASQVGKH